MSSTTTTTTTTTDANQMHTMMMVDTTPDQEMPSSCSCSSNHCGSSDSPSQQQQRTSTSTTGMSVFDMNTRAVVCLKEGRGQEGMEALRDTLVHTRSILIESQQQQHPAASSLTTTTVSNVPPLSLFTVPLYTPPADRDSAHCPLFDRAFVVGGDDSTNDSGWIHDPHCQNVTLGVLLYNLALSHHLSGLTKGGTTADALQEFQVATNLYQMALSLVETSIRDTPASVQDPTNATTTTTPAENECQNLVLLLCAIFNNMANLHSRQFHVEETRNCLECLKEVVSYYYNNGATTTTDSSVLQHQMEVEEDSFFFYLNLFVTAPVHDFAIAPAA